MVAGHLREKNGTFQIVLSFNDALGKSLLYKSAIQDISYYHIPNIIHAVFSY